MKSLNLPLFAVILVFDLISKFKFMIKAQERTEIILDGQVIPTVLSPSVTINVVASEREVCSYLLCPQDIVIPKCSIMCVKLKVVGKSLPERTSVIVITNREFSNFLPFDMITKVSDGFVCVLYFNSLNKPKQILAKTAVATCEPVINAEHVASVSVCQDREQKLLDQIADKTPPLFVQHMGDIALSYRSLFVLSDKEPTDIMPFRIETKEASPVKLRFYRIPVCY